MGETFRSASADPELRTAPARLREAFEDVTLALTETQQAWDSISAECRALVEEDLAGDLRMTMTTMGFTIRQEEVITLEPGGSAHFFDIAPSDRIQRMIILGEAPQAFDVDLALFDPAGNRVDIDEEVDSIPVVSADQPSPGRWGVAIINNADQPTTMLLQQWTQP